MDGTDWPRGTQLVLVVDPPTGLGLTLVGVPPVVFLSSQPTDAQNAAASTARLRSFFIASNPFVTEWVKWTLHATVSQWPQLLRQVRAVLALVARPGPVHGGGDAHGVGRPHGTGVPDHRVGHGAPAPFLDRVLLDVGATSGGIRRLAGRLLVIATNRGERGDGEQRKQLFHGS